MAGELTGELTGGSGNVSAAWGGLNPPAHRCPNCGACPNCGWGGQPPYKVYPTPWPPSWPPYTPYIGDPPGGIGGTTCENKTGLNK